MKKIVLFLHGYGSNGNDLISLKDYISLEKEETEFISPNAPEPCALEHEYSRTLETNSCRII